MALWKKLVLGLLVLVVLVIGAAVQAVVGWRAVLFGPKTRALTERSFEATPERLERGRYLANSVYGCVACHSERDWEAQGAPVVERHGAGTDHEVSPEPGQGQRLHGEQIGGRQSCPVSLKERFPGRSSPLSRLGAVRIGPLSQRLVPSTAFSAPYGEGERLCRACGGGRECA